MNGNTLSPEYVAERKALREANAHGRPLACVILADDGPAAKAFARYNRSGDPNTAGITFNGNPVPCWEELTDNVRAKWLGSIVVVVADDAEYKAEAANRKPVDVLADHIFAAFLNRPSASLADVPPNDRARWVRIASTVIDVFEQNKGLAEQLERVESDEARRSMVDAFASLRERVAMLEEARDGLEEDLDVMGNRGAALAKICYDMAYVLVEVYDEIGDSILIGEGGELSHRAYDYATKVLESHAEALKAIKEAEEGLSEEELSRESAAARADAAIDFKGIEASQVEHDVPNEPRDEDEDEEDEYAFTGHAIGDDEDDDTIDPHDEETDKAIDAYYESQGIPPETALNNPNGIPTEDGYAEVLVTDKTGEQVHAEATEGVTYEDLESNAG